MERYREEISITRTESGVFIPGGALPLPLAEAVQKHIYSLLFVGEPGTLTLRVESISVVRTHEPAMHDYILLQDQARGLQEAAQEVSGGHWEWHLPDSLRLLALAPPCAPFFAEVTLLRWEGA